MLINFYEQSRIWKDLQFSSLTIGEWFAFTIYFMISCVCDIILVAVLFAAALATCVVIKDFLEKPPPKLKHHQENIW